MRHISLEDLEPLAWGASILGSGGGGSTRYNHLLTKELIERNGPIPLLSIDDLDEDHLIVPVAFMGAPLAALEKLPSGLECQAVLQQISHPKMVLMPAEIGGGNAFTALWAASLMGLPCLDGDTIGRAFPELQMSTCFLNNISCSPAFMADALGNVVRIDARQSHTLEKFARSVTVQMGARAFIAIYLMRAVDAKKTIVAGTISQAIELGKAKQITPIYSGMVTDVDQKIEGGFLKGIAQIGEVQLFYQNEYLIAKKGDQILSATPDILMLVEQETLEPVTSSQLRYGLRVDLITLESPPIWKTEAGLKLVGKENFL